MQRRGSNRLRVRRASRGRRYAGVNWTDTAQDIRTPPDFPLMWSDAKCADALKRICDKAGGGDRRVGDRLLLVRRLRYAAEAMRNRGCDVGTRSYNTILALCARLLLAAEAREIAAEMRQRGVRFSERTYPLLAAAVAKEGLAQVELVLAEMRGAGLPFTAHAFGVLLRACAVHKDAAAASAVLARMAEAKVRPEGGARERVMHFPLT